MESNLIVLRRYPARIHAELAKTALDAGGIDSTIVGGDFAWAEGESSSELIVRADDALQAIEILGPEETFSD